MKSIGIISVLITVYIIILAIDVASAQNSVTCVRRNSKCFLKRLRCPAECPRTRPTKSKAKACYLDCNKCEAFCRGNFLNIMTAFWDIIISMYGGKCRELSHILNSSLRFVRDIIHRTGCTIFFQFQGPLISANVFC
jgi:hypothetical protein